MFTYMYIYITLNKCPLNLRSPQRLNPRLQMKPSKTDHEGMRDARSPY